MMTWTGNIKTVIQGQAGVQIDENMSACDRSKQSERCSSADQHYGTPNSITDKSSIYPYLVHTHAQILLALVRETRKMVVAVTRPARTFTGRYHAPYRGLSATGLVWIEFHGGRANGSGKTARSGWPA